MKSIIQVNITHAADTYVAEGVNVPFVTEADTLDELHRNVADAVSLFFQDEDPTDLGFSSTPSILTNYELELPGHVIQA